MKKINSKQHKANAAVPHKLQHGVNIANTALITPEDVGTWSPVVGEPVAIFCHHCWATASIENLWKKSVEMIKNKSSVYCARNKKTKCKHIASGF